MRYIGLWSIVSLFYARARQLENKVWLRLGAFNNAWHNARSGMSGWKALNRLSTVGGQDQYPHAVLAITWH